MHTHTHAIYIYIYICVCVYACTHKAVLTLDVVSDVVCTFNFLYRISYHMQAAPYKTAQLLRAGQARPLLRLLDERLTRRHPETDRQPPYIYTLMFLNICAYISLIYIYIHIHNPQTRNFLPETPNYRACYALRHVRAQRCRNKGRNETF